MVRDLTQWAAPFNINDFRREEIDRQVCERLIFLFSSKIGKYYDKLNIYIYHFDFEDDNTSCSNSGSVATQ